MLLRVRGEGACRENCTALVSYLRGASVNLRPPQDLAIPLPASHSLTKYVPYPIGVIINRASIPALWREISNIADIAFDTDVWRKVAVGNFSGRKEIALLPYAQVVDEVSGETTRLASSFFRWERSPTHFVHLRIHLSHEEDTKSKIVSMRDAAVTIAWCATILPAKLYKIWPSESLGVSSIQFVFPAVLAPEANTSEMFQALGLLTAVSMLPSQDTFGTPKVPPASDIESAMLSKISVVSSSDPTCLAPHKSQENLSVQIWMSEKQRKNVMAELPSDSQTASHQCATSEFVLGECWLAEDPNPPLDDNQATLPRVRDAEATAEAILEGARKNFCPCCH